MSTIISSSDWRGNGAGIFWGELAPSDHLVQIYEDDQVYLDSVEGFVVSGLNEGEGVIVLATQAHLKALDDQLRTHGVDVDAARSQDRFITLDAEECLTKFIVDGWPDNDLFLKFVSELVARAGKDGRRVRAFGELVAVLWARGDNGATVRLEYLWHKLCHAKKFALLCAYPKIGFTQEAAESIREICATHSKIIDGQSLLDSIEAAA